METIAAIYKMTVTVSEVKQQRDLTIHTQLCSAHDHALLAS
jgi:hypothetical protein